MEKFSEVLTNTNSKHPIGTIGLNNLNPIGKTPQTNVIVDMMLADYKDLIDPKYKPWFAKRFYKLPFDLVHRCASEARQEGRNKQSLFTYKIREASHG